MRGGTRSYRSAGKDEQRGNQSPERNDLQREPQQAEEGKGLSARCRPAVDGQGRIHDIVDLFFNTRPDCSDSIRLVRVIVSKIQSTVSQRLRWVGLQTEGGSGRLQIVGCGWNVRPKATATPSRVRPAIGFQSHSVEATLTRPKASELDFESDSVILGEAQKSQRSIREQHPRFQLFLDHRVRPRMASILSYLPPGDGLLPKWLLFVRSRASRSRVLNHG